MKYLLIAMLFISIDSAAQRTVTDSLISKWTDVRGASRDTMVITGTLSTEQWDTQQVIMLWCDTSNVNRLMDNMIQFSTTAGLCYWSIGYSVTQINGIRMYYLDENKKRFDKVVWMSVPIKKEQ